MFQDYILAYSEKGNAHREEKNTLLLLLDDYQKVLY